MQLTMIITHRVPATHQHGTRVSVTGWTSTGGRATRHFPWNYDLSDPQNHQVAAAHVRELVEPAQRRWVGAATHDGYTFLPVRGDTEVTL